MKDYSIEVKVLAEVAYEYRYEGELSQAEVNLVIKTKYNGNLWKALKDEFISDINCETVEKVLA